MKKRKSPFIKLTTLILLFTSISSAELSKECKKSINDFIIIESLKDNALTVQASKKTVQECISTMKNAVDADVAIVEEIMNIGMLAEKELMSKTL